VGIDMLIDKPRCNFKKCRFYFDGNCRSADIYENCKLTDLHSEIAKLTDLHSEIAKLTVDLDNAKTEVARGIFAEIEKISKAPYGYICLSNDELAELKKKYTEEKT
jgi:hypothetical protein